LTDLKGRRAIVTGAATGLGNAYARALAEKGVDVAVCDVRPEIEALPEKLRAAGVRSLAWRADVSDPDDVRRVVDGAREAFGGVDILVNNAGVCRVTLPTDDLDKSLDDYDALVGTNLKGAYLFGRAVIPILIEQGQGGDIVNVATDHIHTCGTPHDVCPNLPTCAWNQPEPAFPGPPRPTGGGDVMDLYDASKWGLNGLLFAWAKALRPHGIRVNGLCMGATDSNMLRSFAGKDVRDEVVATWMRPEDAARVLVELLEEGPGGRTARNLNFCTGRPVELEPALPLLYITEDSLRPGGA